MTTAQAAATYETTEAAFDVAVRNVRHAEGALRRSKSAKNREAFAQAQEAFDAALALTITAREAYEDASRREELTERLAARAARRLPQIDLFA